MIKTAVKYYCDRCGKEIVSKPLLPTLYYRTTLSSSKLEWFEGLSHEKQLCNECGEELKKFLDGTELKN